MNYVYSLYAARQGEDRILIRQGSYLNNTKNQWQYGQNSRHPDSHSLINLWSVLAPADYSLSLSSKHTKWICHHG